MIIKKLILIIDDDADDVEIIETNLRCAGFTNIISARNGEEGIESVKENKPFIAIIDTNLTGMNGFETCKEIKKIEGIDVKIIIMTGSIDAIDAVKASEAQTDEYCVKTIDSKLVIESVSKIIANKE